MISLARVQIVHGSLIALCGLAFLIWARLWPAAMTPNAYGYAAYDMSAEAWSLAYVSAGALVVIGASMAGQWALALAARVSGLALLVAMSYILVVSAWGANEGAPVVIFSAFYFGPVSAILIALTLADRRRHGTA